MDCRQCGADNPARASFCLSCGSALDAESAEVRKTVTVLFSDISGSTALGEVLDAESVRTAMGRYFAVAKRIVERHDGVVEKFIGDAVMAVFGIPALHEDDALRAVHAAVDIRDAVRNLNVELSTQFGADVLVRTGVNTGVVVAGDPSARQMLVTGDAVNTAARLQQAAAPGEILLGPMTVVLVRDAVRTEAVQPLQLKGKAKPFQAFRLVEGLEAHAERRLDSPMVERDSELMKLQQAVTDAVMLRRRRLCTVVGQAGIGKSRLVQELIGTLRGRARALKGRCLPYGEGITFWPVREIVYEAAGVFDGDPLDAAMAKIARLVPGNEARRVSGQVGALIGLGEAAGSEAEGFAAFRRLLESMADAEPLVVVIEDLHWAEPALLDLIEYTALGTSDAPLVVICTARPEFTERRAGWSGAAPDAMSIPLHPLTAAGINELLSHLLGETDIAANVGRTISEAADGNPLFVEEFFSMLVDEGTVARRDGAWVVIGDVSESRVPASIQALLGARIDQLAPEERTVLQRASVIGRVFYLGAVSDLSPEPVRGRIASHLVSLVRKALVVPAASDLAAEDTYRFRHILIRDAAYELIPKATRADLHARLARWVERRAGEHIAEFEEIVGYHLEQAYGYRGQLGMAEPWRDVAEHAAEHLANSGRRALARGDVRAAAGLLARARGLLRTGSSTHRESGLDLAAALTNVGAFSEAAAVLEEVESAAGGVGDKVHAEHARLGLAEINVFVDPEGGADRARAVADAAMSVFEESGDEAGLAKAWRVRSHKDRALERFEPHQQALEQALIHLHKADDRRGVLQLLGEIAHAVAFGPTPIPDAIQRLEAILSEVGEDRELTANVRIRIGFLLAQAGRGNEALAAESEARAIFEDLGVDFYLGRFGLLAADLMLFLGRPDEAEKMLRRSDEIFERVGERGVRPTVLVRLASALFEQGRDTEAEQSARLALRLGATDDLGTVVGALVVLARIGAARGSSGAEATARRAVALAEKTDMLWNQGEAWEALASVLLGLGRDDEAREALREAVTRFERKGATLLSYRARTRFGGRVRRKPTE